MLVRQINILRCKIVPRYRQFQFLGSADRIKFQNRSLSFDKKNGDSSSDKYLTSLGYSNTNVQEGMKDALKGVFGNKITVDNLKSLGAPGLEALAKSVQKELDLQDPNAFVGTVHVEVPHHGFNFDIHLREGENLMDSVTTGEGKDILGEYLECVCSGNMACSTCHVILDEDTYSKLDTPCEAELDMLDLAFEPTGTSRLGCQIKMSKNIDGMTITMPSGVNNMF